MNILIFSASFNHTYMGGHISSMLTIGNELVQNKLNVLICLPETLGKNNGANEIGEIFPLNKIIWVPKSKYLLNIINFKNYLYDVIKNNNIDIIHSFDLHGHIIARFCIRKFDYKLKALSNVCGGMIKYKYPYTFPIIVFTEELKDLIQGMYKIHPPEVILEKARMRPSFYLSGLHEEKLTLDLKKKISNKKVILMVTRMSIIKIKAIMLALKSVEKLANKRVDFIFILIGRVNTKAVYNFVKKKVDLINKKNKRQVILFDNNLSHITRNIFPLSDIVIGVAKVCFEGMLYKKPVVVLGTNGCSGLVNIEDNEKFEKMVYNNFSSRDVTKKFNETEKIILNLEILLNDRATRHKLGKKNFNWLRNNLNIRSGIDTYISAYRNLNRNTHQKILPLRFAYYGILIIFLGTISGFMREFYLRLKLWRL
jgi:hypothetical protein